MTRLVGWFCNQAGRLECAAATESEALGLDAGRADGWGIGSYHAGEVILRKKPGEPRASVRFEEVVRDLRSPCAVAQVRRATAGDKSLDNTHPFRFRSWLFAHLGSVNGFEARKDALKALVPEFLARNVRGQTDSEWLFHLLLSDLWDTGRLDDGELDRATIVATIQTALGKLDEALGVASPMAFVMTQGRVMVAFARGVPAQFVRRQGVRECPACKRSGAADEALKYVLFASGGDVTGPGWKALASEGKGSFLSIDGKMEAVVTALE